MMSRLRYCLHGGAEWYLVVALLLFLGAVAHPATHAQAFSVSVVNPSGTPLANYRWVVEEDVSYDVVPGVLNPDRLSTNFHKTSFPVVATGDETTVGDLAALDPS